MSTRLLVTRRAIKSRCPPAWGGAGVGLPGPARLRWSGAGVIVGVVVTGDLPSRLRAGAASVMALPVSRLWIAALGWWLGLWLARVASRSWSGCDGWQIVTCSAW